MASSKLEMSLDDLVKQSRTKIGGSRGGSRGGARGGARGSTRGNTRSRGTGRVVKTKTGAQSAKDVQRPQKGRGFRGDKKFVSKINLSGSSPLGRGRGQTAGANSPATTITRGRGGRGRGRGQGRGRGGRVETSRVSNRAISSIPNTPPPVPSLHEAKKIRVIVKRASTGKGNVATDMNSKAPGGIAKTKLGTRTVKTNNVQKGAKSPNTAVKRINRNANRAKPNAGGNNNNNNNNNNNANTTNENNRNHNDNNGNRNSNAATVRKVVIRKNANTNGNQSLTQRFKLAK